jgi:hypothetical protein
MKAVRNMYISRGLKQANIKIFTNQAEILSRKLAFSAIGALCLCYLSLDGSQKQESAKIHHSWVYLLRWPRKEKLGVVENKNSAFQIHTSGIPFVLEGFRER